MEDALEQVFRAWHDRAEELLPEFDFYRKRNGEYVSKSGLKITGEHGDKKDAVRYYENNPYTLIDYTRGPKSLLQYLQESKGLATRGEAFRYMAQRVGITLQSFKSEEDRQRWEARQRVYETREAALQFYVDALHGNNTPEAHTPQAEAVRHYLKERGYKREDLRPPYEEGAAEGSFMQLGFFCGVNELQRHLQGQGFTLDEIREAITSRLPAALERGRHPLVIPYRSAAGNIVGFSYRRIVDREDGPKEKYLHDRVHDMDPRISDHLFNLTRKTGADHIVIVEGQLDSMIAQARGIQGVVALCGNAFKGQQAAEAVRAVKDGGSITLCMDADGAGQGAVQRGIDVLLETIREQGRRISIFVAQLPAGYKDPDQLITRAGADEFRKVIDERVRELHYMQDQLLRPYAGKGELLPAEQDRLLKDIVQAAAKLHTPVDRSQFTEHFKELFTGIVSDKALLETAEQLAYEREAEQQRKDIKKAADALKQAIDAGTDPAEAMRKFEAQSDRIKAIRGSKLLEPYRKADWERDVTGRQGALKTGFLNFDREISIPRGGFTLIAGRTSHGKTTVMFNMALRMIKQYPGMRFYFLSYEEVKSRLLSKITCSLIDTPLDQLLPDLTETSDWASKLETYVKQRTAERRIEIPEIEHAISKVAQLLESGRFTITDRKYYIEELEALITSEHKRHGNVGAVFIDYATKIKSLKMQDQRAQVREEMIHVTEQLEEIAKRTDTALIVGAQLNRQAAQRGSGTTNERPRLEHLKESGSLEESANTVIAIYNAAAEDTEKDRAGADWEQEVMLEAQVLKARDGKRNYKAYLWMDGRRRRIKDATNDERSAYLAKKGEA